MKTESGEVTKRKMSMVKRILIAILVLCVIAIIWGSHGPFYRTRVVNKPISLASKSPVSVDFTVDRTFRYQLALFSEKPESQPTKDRLRSGSVALNWEISEDGHGFASGQYRQSGDKKWDSLSNWLDIDYIALQRGHTYRIVITPTGDVAEWDDVKQFVRLGLHPAALESYIGLQLLGWLIGGLVAIGLCIILLSESIRRPTKQTSAVGEGGLK